MNMLDEQEIWERVFTGALQGAATSTNGWAEDRCEYLLNRAERLADAAVERIRQRRAAMERVQEAKPF